MKAAVVSYSSAVVSLFCDFRPVLDGRGDAGRSGRAGSAPSWGVFSSGGFLQLRSRSAGADWAVHVPLRRAHDSSPAAHGSNYPRALSMCVGRCLRAEAPPPLARLPRGDRRGPLRAVRPGRVPAALCGLV